jgi:hypothetical protein
MELSTHPKAGGLMKPFLPIWGIMLSTFLSTHPKAGGLMKPRPLKPLSTQADKYIFVR